MQKISFTKMHVLGNDFMVIDNTRKHYHITTNNVSMWSDRHTGIGFDQCLVIEPSIKYDFFYRIFNADGSQVGQCGNGALAIGKFILHNKLSSKRTLTLETQTTALTLKVDERGNVNLIMPIAKISPYSKKLPLLDYYTAFLVDVGNPHLVIFSTNQRYDNIAEHSNSINKMDEFSSGININFAQIMDSGIKLAVYERGVGPTQACGSGAAATAAAGCLYHKLACDITVTQPGGKLNVSILEAKHEISIAGPVTFIYHGEVF